MTHIEIFFLAVLATAIVCLVAWAVVKMRERKNSTDTPTAATNDPSATTGKKTDLCIQNNSKEENKGTEMNTQNDTTQKNSFLWSLLWFVMHLAIELIGGALILSIANSELTFTDVTENMMAMFPVGWAGNWLPTLITIGIIHFGPPIWIGEEPGKKSSFLATIYILAFEIIGSLAYYGEFNEFPSASFPIIIAIAVDLFFLYHKKNEHQGEFDLNYVLSKLETTWKNANLDNSYNDAKEKISAKYEELKECSSSWIYASCFALLYLETFKSSFETRKWYLNNKEQDDEIVRAIANTYSNLGKIVLLSSPFASSNLSSRRYEVIDKLEEHYTSTE